MKARPGQRYSEMREYPAVSCPWISFAFDRVRILKLDRYQSQFRIKPSQIHWIARDNSKACPLRAYDNMGIDDVRHTCLCKQRSNSLCVRSVEWHNLRLVELDHTPKTYLPRRVSYDLRENCSWYDDASPVVKGSLQN